MDTRMKVPDYNPDREGHVSHKWIVTKATTNPNFRTVDLGDRSLKFDQEGRFSVKDPGVADAIRKEHRWDVAVTRVRDPSAHDRGHTYFFTVPEMPWKRKVSDGEEYETGRGRTLPEDGQEAEREGAQPEGSGGGDWAQEIRP